MGFFLGPDSIYIHMPFRPVVRGMAKWSMCHSSFHARAVGQILFCQKRGHFWTAPNNLPENGPLGKHVLGLNARTKKEKIPYIGKK